MRKNRVIALLLALVMVLSVLPTSVSAMSQVSSSNPEVTFNITASDSFGGMLGTAGEPTQINDTLDYTFNMDPSIFNGPSAQEVQSYSSLDTEGKREWEAAQGAKFDANIANLNSMYSGKSEIVASKGDTVYIGVDMGFNDADGTYQGMMMGSLMLVYRSDVFTYADSSVVVNGIQSNAILGNTLAGNFGRINVLDAPFTAEYVSGAAEISVTELSNIRDLQFSQDGAAEESLENYKVLSLTMDNTGLKNGSSSVFYLSEKTTWDYVIPFTVSPEAEIGDYTFGVVYNLQLTDNSGGTAAQLSDIKVDKVTDVTTRPTGYKIGNTRINENTENFTLTEATVQVREFSDPPEVVDPEQYDVTDKKNLPYVSAEYAENTTLEGPNDYIVLPANSGFAENDTVVVYADEEGTQELGRTKITKANVYDETGTKWGVDSIDLTKPTTLRLVNNEENGTGYLKGEKQVWIARVQPNGTGDGDKSPSKTKVGPIDVTAGTPGENPLYYTGNVDAVPKSTDPKVKSAPGAKDNPIEIYLGDTLDSVLNTIKINGINLPTTVMAPYESALDKTVGVTLDWSKLAETAQQGLTDGVFTLHTAKDGTTALVLPYPSTTVEGTSIEQPTEYYADGKAATAPVYGAAIYVKVLPRVQDYFVVNSIESGMKLELYGKTAEILKENDVIKLYKTETGDDLIDTITIANGVEGIQKSYTITEGGQTLPGDGKSVWLEVTQMPENVTTARFETTVSDGKTLQVVRSEVVTGDGNNGEVLISPTTTAEGLFKEAAPLQFYVQTISDPLTVNLENIDYDDTDDGSADVTYNLDTLGDGNKGEEVGKRTYAQFNEKKYKENVYGVAYTIQGGSIPVEGEDPISYVNDAKHTISMKAGIIDRIEVDADAKGTVTKNAPDGERTTSNTDGLTDTKNFDLIEMTVNNTGIEENSKIAQGDRVSVYNDGAEKPFTTGYVYEVSGSDEAKSVKIKVNQLGREPDLTKMHFIISRDNIYNTREIRFTNESTVKEEYTLLVNESGNIDVPWSSDVIKVKDNSFESVEAVITAVPSLAKITPKYSYLTAGKVDETTIQDAKEITLTPANWKQEGVSNPADFNGERPSTYTVQSSEITAADGITINCDKEQYDLTATLKLVSEEFKDDPDNNEVAEEIMGDADSKVANKPYPAKDTVQIKDKNIEGKTVSGLIVKVYASQEDATNQVNAVANFTLEGNDSLKSAEVENNVFSDEGGTFYVTFETAETAPSSYNKGYDASQYIVWDVAVPDSLKTIKVKRPEPVDDQDAEFARIQSFLPASVNVQVVHLKDGASGGLEPATSKYISVPVTAEDWINTDTGMALAKEDFGAFDTEADKVFNLTTTLEEADVQDKTVTYVSGEEIKTVGVLFSQGGVTQPEGFATDSISLDYNKDNLLETTLPANPEDYIKPNNGNTAETSDDTIEIDFSTAPDFEGSDVAGSDVTITYPGPNGPETITGKLDEDGKLTINTSDSTPTFDGFDPNGGDMTIVFEKKPDKGPSQPVIVPVPPLSGAYVLSSEPVVLKTLNLEAGSIGSAQQLLLAVPEETVTVPADDGTMIPDVPLKKAGEPLAVEWKLYQGTGADGSVTWGDEPVADWAEALKTYSTDTAFKLVAETELPEGFEYQNKEVKQPEGTVAKAEVKISLYDPSITDPDEPGALPLALTEGNSDLYHHGNESGSPASKQLASLQKTNPELKAEDFRTDLVFYFHTENYDEDVKPYVESGIQSLKVGDETVNAADFEAKGYKVDVKQLNVDGTAISIDTNIGDVPGTTNNIEPTHSDKNADYFVPGKSISRYNENYIIQYTVTDTDGNTYVAVRDVKLRYMAADADSDGVAAATDIAITRNDLLKKTSIFVDSEGTIDSEILTQMELDVVDFDYDLVAGTTDIALVRNFLLKKTTIENNRW